MKKKESKRKEGHKAGKKMGKEEKGRHECKGMKGKK